ncbi:MAG: signal recognition particle subunit SRP19/SEC65 family protein [Candidatus Heimdallarchaeota archaeon]
MSLRRERDLMFYPEYFDVNLSRAEGRRIPRNLAIKSPRVKELYLAAKRANLEVTLRESIAYTRRWWDKRGAIVVKKTALKTEILKQLTKSLREVRIELLRKKKEQLKKKKLSADRGRKRK